MVLQNFKNVTLAVYGESFFCIWSETPYTEKDAHSRARKMPGDAHKAHYIKMKEGIISEKHS